ncbi:MAG: glycosyltransferase [Desulfobacterales bacterium]|nr:glycosyltransferase [Desulfobacterales bacterium]
MKRVCIFAHYDKDNLIDDYVIFYIKKLKKICFKIIFVSDCDLNQKEINKVSEYCDPILAKKHGKYDFGSYQKGILSIKDNLNEYDELIFCNDSCYGPFFELNIIFDKMQSKEWDFWGFTKNKSDVLDGELLEEHLQSFFLVFKKNVFKSEVFIDFIKSIKIELNKHDIIKKYEVGLSKQLVEAGFKYLTYIDFREIQGNIVANNWKELIDNGFPFVKVLLIKKGVIDWEKSIKQHSDYPTDIIKIHMKRIRTFDDYYRLLKLKILTLKIVSQSVRFLQKLKAFIKIIFNEIPRYPFFFPQLIKILFYRIYNLGYRNIFMLIINIPYSYEKWISAFEPPVRSYPKFAQKAVSWEHKPLISIIMPTYNSNLVYLEKAIESVQQQIYTNWQLCIADDASTELSGVKDLLLTYAAKDKRINVVFCNANGHISTASNSALNLANGEFVALLDHDDVLHPLALWFMADAIIQNPAACLIYSDFDLMTTTGKRFNPYFKCDYNYELMLGQNIIAHLDCYRRSLLAEIDGFRKGFEGAQDWDLALRCIERLSRDQIIHIPRVLYHWRLSPGSITTGIKTKPYVVEATLRCVSDHLLRRELSVDISNHPNSLTMNRVKFNPPTPSFQPMVSIIIHTRNRSNLLNTCIKSIHTKTSYHNYEIIVVNNNSIDDETLTQLKKLQKVRVLVIHDKSSLNCFCLNNIAARVAKGRILCFMHDGIKIISPNWIEEMMSHAVRDDIGAVGACLWYPNNKLQHGCLILGYSSFGIAGHAFTNLKRGDTGYYGSAVLLREVSAVSGSCLMIRKQLFEQVEGFDKSLGVTFNDIDFCLKIRKLGYRNVWTPYAEMYYYKSTHNHNYELNNYYKFKKEYDLMLQRWRDILSNDPFYSPNLSMWWLSYHIAWPPRIKQFPC